ncbi:histidine phosphatase family protein [Azospirillum sp. RWY-5-1]|uniref:Histidine phosphatase family protein n=1 Tax=Azospirillum oleiclasticum TaxID=2735135 RepID=A0ABX2TKB3_9PROT|nr:histidine phosphatase family protein [Azospirillum oleiclasticum]NYZ15997.1 histidine phosphatase family protein [Azospirillum oleiclasticum]NYZ23524.1 histidine phosphatase family protein [Azospirillum oleiclasticum]
MPARFARRRLFLLSALLALLAGAPAVATAATGSEAAAWAALARGGHVILMRHAATVPGTGDPPGFRLGDCATQRNLSDAGRADARAAGERLRREGVRVDEALTSVWCRSFETAELMAVAPVRVEPAVNSFFDGQGDREAQTDAARRLVASWRGPGNRLMVTHQVNITALTGVFPQQGEMVVLAPAGGGFTAVGRIRP